MRRLVWAFAGRTYRIVVNLMPMLISSYSSIRSNIFVEYFSCFDFNGGILKGYMIMVYKESSLHENITSFLYIYVPACAKLVLFKLFAKKTMYNSDPIDFGNVRVISL